MHRIAFLLGCCLLAACGGDKADAERAQGDDGLPKPAAASGSVTGMPNPGVAEPRPSAGIAQAPDIVEYPEPVDAGEMPPVDPAAQPLPIEGPPMPLPDAPMPEDPNAPPPAPPEQTENRATDPARQ
ncbi:MAG TPA: hypothetical protein VN205_12895 [Thermomonas sp.]|nr:hypothetical protein [Thermomonas sp.]